MLLKVQADKIAARETCQTQTIFCVSILINRFEDWEINGGRTEEEVYIKAEVFNAKSQVGNRNKEWERKNGLRERK